MKGDVMKEAFISRLQELDITVTDNQYQQFERYYDTLIAWNKKMNLTAITDKDDVFLKHFYDSLCFVKGIKLTNQALLDVGSGAGFPSIPLKIVYPNLQITIIDALQKRIMFLDALKNTLKLDVTLVHGRVESFDERASYDIVTARAVAPLNVLCELCLPFVKVGGVFLPLKGGSVDEELKESGDAIALLGGRQEQTIVYSYANNTRSLLKIRKIKETPNKYPRSFNKIKKNPL